MAQPFYDRLIEIGNVSVYPWATSSAPADDFAVANLGQVKNIFGFDLTNLPVSTGSSLPAGSVGSPFSYNIGANHNPASYTATGLPPGLLLNSQTGAITGTPTRGGIYVVAVKATNATGTTTESFTFVVNSPSFAITSPASLNVEQGASFTYQITASQPATSYAALNLPYGCSVDPSSGLISGAAFLSGTYPVVLSATTGSGTASGILHLSVTPAPPTIVSALQDTATVGAPYRYGIQGSNDPAGFLASGPNGAALPAGLVYADGLISGTPSTAGTYSITIGATNSTGTGTATLVLVVAAQQSPVITAPAQDTARVGDYYQAPIYITNNPTVFTATGPNNSSLPAGLSVVFQDGLTTINGTPATPGVYTISLSAGNAVGTGTATLVLTVSPQAAPAFSSPAEDFAGINQSYLYTLRADNNPTTYGATGANDAALPSGLVFSADAWAGASISGTPAVAGSYLITLTASNSSGTATQILHLTVENPPVITSAGNSAVTVGLPFSYQITAANRPESFSVDNIPPGLTYDYLTGIIQGTIGQAGVSTMQIYASNLAGNGQASLSLTASDPTGAPIINSGPSAFIRGDGVTSANVYQVTTSNGATAFAADGLPQGFQIDAETGIISGGSSQVGLYPVTVSATNVHGTSSQSLAFHVDRPAPSAWFSHDIGSPPLTGDEDVDPDTGVFALHGSRSGLAVAADSFHFLTEQMSGDGQMVARIPSVDATNPAASAGIVIRDGLDPAESETGLVFTSARTVQFSSRSTPGAVLNTMTAPGVLTGPVWLKLVRRGNVFTGYESIDGVNWTQVSQATVPMWDTVYAGLAVCAQDRRRVCAGIFDLVAPQKPFSVNMASPAPGSHFNIGDPIFLSATVQNGMGYDTKVKFMNGQARLGEAAAPPFNLAWTEPPLGNSSVFALAIDSSAASAVSPSLDLSVQVNGGAFSLPAFWEQRYFGHLGVNPNALSPGGSGLTNAQSFLLGLDPTIRDSDGDGIADGDAVAAGQDPRAALLGFQVYTPLQINH